MTGKDFTTAEEADKTSIWDNQKNTLEKLAKLGTSWSPSFAPDGKSLAYVSDVSGSLQAWIVEIDGGASKRITKSDDPIGIISWSPESSKILLSVAPGGNGGEVQLFTVSPDGSGLSRISKGGNEANWAGPWIKNSTLLPITSNFSDPTSYDSYLLDLETGDYTFVSKNKGLALFLDVSPDGRKGLLYQMEGRGSNRIFLVNFYDDNRVLITPENGTSSFTNARFSKDGKSVYLSSNHKSNFSAFCQILLASTNNPPVLETVAENPQGDLEDFALSPDGMIAVFFWNICGATQLEFFHTDSLSREKGPSLPGEIASSPVFSPNGRLLAFTLSGPALPENIFLLDLETRQISQLTQSNDHGIDLNSLVRPKMVAFSSHDDLTLSGWLYLPRDFRQPGPMIISFHGGPEAQERPRFRSDYQIFLESGLAVFAPNVRGSTGFGKSFVALDNGTLRFNAIKDIKACTDYVVSQGIADPKRIGIFGASYGGYMVMAGLTNYPDLFSAGASLYGVVNFATFFKNTHPSMAEISKTKFGDPVSQANLLRELSPINKIDKIRAPTILFHGKNDSNVPLNESEQIYASLERIGISTKLIVFHDEGHGFLNVNNQNRCTLETVAWFKKYL